MAGWVVMVISGGEALTGLMVIAVGLYTEWQG